MCFLQKSGQDISPANKSLRICLDTDLIFLKTGERHRQPDVPHLTVPVCWREHPDRVVGSLDFSQPYAGDGDYSESPQIDCRAAHEE
jgi:hypothetical protein